jgi:predicted metalloprotease with PDZ domain
MITRALSLFVLLGALSLRAQETPPKLSISFDVDATRPESGLVHVSAVLSNNAEESLKVALPAWAPGAYRLMSYAKAVQNLAATGAGEAPLAVASVDERTWKIGAGKSGKIRISYDLAVEKTRMSPDHCFLAGPDSYFYVEGHKEAPCRVRFRVPEGWRVGTALEAQGPEYAARDYDTLIDCPTELGAFDLYEFEEDGATYQLVVHSKGPVDQKKLVGMCRKVVHEQNAVFGVPPFRRYVFFYHFRDGPGGRGLEHLNSTDIVLSYPAVKADPKLAASITSHEYFHLWNVKRIRPYELGPFDYTGIVRSKALWFCEGVTSYFGDRALPRCGLWSDQTYLNHLASEIERLQNNPDRKVTSVEKASETVWDRKDWPRVDYYNKGELLGLLIDLKIRTTTAGERGLDDVMRLLWRRYVMDPERQGKGWIGVGYPEDGLRLAVEDVSGKDWKEFFAQFVSGVEELPFEEVLAGAGLQARIAVARQPDLGVELQGPVVVLVPPLGEAAKAGVKPGDRISAINGVEVSRANFRDQVQKLKPGDEVQLRLTRGEETLEVTFKTVSRERTSCSLSRVKEPTEAQKKILERWCFRRADY